MKKKKNGSLSLVNLAVAYLIVIIGLHFWLASIFDNGRAENASPQQDELAKAQPSIESETDIPAPMKPAPIERPESPSAETTETVSSADIGQAELSTEQLWGEDESRDVNIKLPGPVFVDDSCTEVSVTYPRQVSAGNVAVITADIKATDGRLYRGHCYISAQDDLQIVYGSDDPRTASGGEFDIMAADEMRVHFYTSATEEHRKNRPGTHGESGCHGRVSVYLQDDLW